MKICKDCGKTLPLSNFRPKPSNKDGLETRCKDCRNIRYNKADPHRVFAKIYERQVHHSVSRGHPPPAYSLEQLIAWADAQPQLYQLWQDYVASGYQTKLRPSCDRKDNSRSYELSNLDLMTWQENRARGARDKKAGTLNANQRAVAAFNADGTLHREYSSIMEAVRAVDGSMWGISSVANGVPIKDGRGALYTPRTYKGFVWKWI